jgi:hypothetical protein
MTGNLDTERVLDQLLEQLAEDVDALNKARQRVGVTCARIAVVSGATVPPATAEVARAAAHARSADAVPPIVPPAKPSPRPPVDPVRSPLFGGKLADDNDDEEDDDQGEPDEEAPGPDLEDEDDGGEVVTAAKKRGVTVRTSAAKRPPPQARAAAPRPPPQRRRHARGAGGRPARAPGPARLVGHRHADQAAERRDVGAALEDGHRRRAHEARGPRHALRAGEGALR